MKAEPKPFVPVEEAEFEESQNGHSAFKRYDEIDEKDLVNS